MRIHVFLASVLVLLTSSFVGVPAAGFESNVSLSETGMMASWPAIAADEMGTYVVWQDKSSGDFDILFSISKNNGTTFSEPVVVNDNPGDGNHSSFPDIAVGNGRICVVWEDNRNGVTDIYFSQSSDGKVFTEDIAVWESVTNSSSRPSVAIDADNDLIYVVWVDDFKSISASVSSDGGYTFSTPVTVSDSTKNGRFDPRVDVDFNGKVYVVWADGRTGLVQRGPFNVDDTDIFIANSTDNGQSFGTNVRVNKEYREILQAHPSLTIDGSGTLHIVWDDELTYVEPSILYSTSSDGFHFSDPVFVNFTSPVVNGVGTTHQTPEIEVSESGDFVFISWTESRSGNFNIYLARSDERGFHPAMTIFGGNYFFDDALTFNGYRDPGEAVVLDDGNGVLDSGRLNGSDSPDIVVLAGRANLQEDITGDGLLFYDENSDGWGFDDDIVLETPVLSYPSIEPKMRSPWDNTTGNSVNYLRLNDSFHYVVERHEAMSIGWFDIEDARDAGLNPENFGLENNDPISKAEIEITYKTDITYDGMSFINVSKGLVDPISLFPIVNTGGVEDVTTIDLMSLGFQTIPDLKSMNVSFMNTATTPSNVSFDKISLWIDRGLPGRFDSYDFLIYNGSADLALNSTLTPFVDEDNLMFLDASMDGYYDLGEALVVTSVDIDPGGQITNSELILPRADEPHWGPPFAPFPLNDDTGTSSQYSPSIAIDSGGGCYAVWVDYRGEIASVYYADTVADAWPPHVIGVTPAGSSTNVLPDSEITLIFSEPMDEQSVASSFSIFPPTAGTWNWSLDGDAAVFQPLYGLLANVTYKLEVSSSAADLSGNSMKDRFTWHFKTTTLPIVSCLANETVRIHTDIQVVCNVTDKWGVESVTLSYMGVSEENYTSTNMTLVSGNETSGSWQETIPAQVYPGWVQFFVTAESLIGARGRFPVFEDRVVRVEDVVSPTLQHEGVEPTIAGSRVNVTVVVSDDAGIERVVLYVKTIGANAFVPHEMHQTPQTDEYYVEIDVPNQNGKIEYYFQVTDAGGNVATLPADNPEAHPYTIVVTAAIDAEQYFWIVLTIVLSILIVLLILYLAKTKD